MAGLLLHWAAGEGKLDVVKYLIDEKKADFNVKDNYSRTPLHLAARFGNLDLVKYLMMIKRLILMLRKRMAGLLYS